MTAASAGRVAKLSSGKKLRLVWAGAGGTGMLLVLRL